VERVSNHRREEQLCGGNLRRSVSALYQGQTCRRGKCYAEQYECPNDSQNSPSHREKLRQLPRYANNTLNFLPAVPIEFENIGFQRFPRPTFFRTSSKPTPGPPGTTLVQISSLSLCPSGIILQFGLCSALSHLKSSTWSQWFRTGSSEDAV